MSNGRAVLRLAIVAVLGVLVGAMPSIINWALRDACEPLCPNDLDLTLPLLAALTLGGTAGLVRGGWLAWLVLAAAAAGSAAVLVFATVPRATLPNQVGSSLLVFALGLVPATIGFAAVRGVLRLLPRIHEPGAPDEAGDTTEPASRDSTSRDPR